MYGYVKNTFQFTLSPFDWGSIKKKQTSSPDGPNTKMRGCCGRELDRTHILDGNLDGGSNSSSVISGSGIRVTQGEKIVDQIIMNYLILIVINLKKLQTFISRTDYGHIIILR